MGDVFVVDVVGRWGGGVPILAGLRWVLADFSFRKGSELVEAPDRRVVGAKGENPHCRP